MTATLESRCMARDNFQCVRCGAHLEAGVWPGYSCHHRQSRSVGPDTLDNRIMLCGSGSTGCHGWVHNHPKEAGIEELPGDTGGNGFIVSRFVKQDDIARIPVRHHLLGMVYYDKDGGYVLAA